MWKAHTGLMGLGHILPNNFPCLSTHHLGEVRAWGSTYSLENRNLRLDQSLHSYCFTAGSL